MKKIILMLAAVSMVFGTAAQSNQVSREQMLREWRQTVQKRHRPESLLKDIVPLQQTVATKSAAKYHRGMPADNFWFPGEWEEVQAVVVTPYYIYQSTNSNYQGYNYMADPIVPGWAAIYQNYQYKTMTPYTSEMDTTSAFGQTAFYLMDAIQMGGAQAWVRVENNADTAAVLQHLTTMGLRHNNIRFLVAPGNAFWFRDCGPICFYYGEGDTVGMLDFEYYPGRALDDSLPVYIERQFGLPNFTTQIEWEGGNCLVDGAGMVFSSDEIYNTNADIEGQYIWDGVNINTLTQIRKNPLTPAQVKDSLRHLIGPRATHILTAFQYDGGTGHVDLYADMIDENQFVFSKMPDNYRNWVDYKTGKRNMDSLCSYYSVFDWNYRASYSPFPKTDNGGNFISQDQYNNRYTRTYSNHTFVNNLIIQPCFSTVGSDGMPTAAWDRANIEEIQKAYPGYTIYCVDVREFDGSGGAIHCITKQIPAEHPIRILHRSRVGNTGPTFVNRDFDVMAYITNVDGIASAKVVYRLSGGEWQEAPLTAGENNRYLGFIPTSQFFAANPTDTTQVVEYYITVTSNAGKTITKPMTAAQGGYFSFYPSNDVTMGVQKISGEERFGQFYPNPAAEIANLRIDLADGERYAVSILDAAGRTIHASILDTAGQIVYTINTGRMASGIYTVLFQNGSERIARRLVVK